jgi:hypothetical protein
LTPAMEELFRAHRRSTRAVLLSFHVAAPLSGGEGTPWQKAWAAMGRVPHELLENIIVHAGFEIPKSVRRSLPRTPSVVTRVEGTRSRWGPCVDTWEYMTPTPPGAATSVSL